MNYYRIFFNRFSNFTTYQFNNKDLVLRLGCVQDKLVNEIIEVYTINKKLIFSSHLKKREYVKNIDFVKKIVGKPVKYYFVIEDEFEKEIGNISFTNIQGNECYKMQINNDKFIFYDSGDYIKVKFNGKIISTISYVDHNPSEYYSLECENDDKISEILLMIMYYDLNRKNILAHNKEIITSTKKIAKPVINMSDISFNDEK